MVISCDGSKIETNAARLAYTVEIATAAFTDCL